MEELFPSIPDEIRAKTQFWLDMVFAQKDILTGLKMFTEYLESCEDEEEKAYIDFCFQSRLEQLKNESNIN